MFKINITRGIKVKIEIQKSLIILSCDFINFCISGSEDL